MILAALFVGGQEALEGEPPCGQARHAQGRDHSARAGNGGNDDIIGSAQGHQVLAGIGNGRGTGVGHQSAGFSIENTFQNPLAAFGAVVLIIADEGFLDAHMVQQLQTDPGILGSDKIRLFQSFTAPLGNVPQIADGRGDEI